MLDAPASRKMVTTRLRRDGIGGREQLAEAAAPLNVTAECNATVQRAADMGGCKRWPPAFRRHAEWMFWGCSVVA